MCSNGQGLALGGILAQLAIRMCVKPFFGVARGHPCLAMLQPAYAPFNNPASADGRAALCRLQACCSLCRLKWQHEKPSLSLTLLPGLTVGSIDPKRNQHTSMQTSIILTQGSHKALHTAKPAVKHAPMATCHFTPNFFRIAMRAGSVWLAQA